ncbi:hypothetical protein D3C78_1785960 [compost metagenome]
MDQPGVGKSILGVEGLAPAWVGNYHIRAIAFGLQIQQQAQHLLAMQHGVLEGAHVRMGLRTRRPVWLVAQ